MAVSDLTVRGPKRAVVLAAGRGSRLGELTAETPKPLMTLGDTTLLGRQLRQMEQRGVARVTVVVGYLEHVLREWLSKWPGQLDVHCVTNPDWAVTGSGASLLYAIDEFTAGDGVLLTHGDIVYDDSILDEVLASGGTVVAADRSWKSLTGDEVVAWSAGGRLAGVIKGAPPEGCEASGEFIGVSVFSAEFAAAFAQFCKGRSEHSRTEDYEQPLLSDFVGAGAQGTVAFTDHVHWMNVNYEDDLAHVRQHFAITATRD
ncbi:MAG: choline kinase [Pseudohongiellaceae bacterium]|jgi:choline kinase